MPRRHHAKRAATAAIAITIAGAAAFLTPAARAIDEAHHRQAREMSERAIQWLRSQQDPDTGAWSPNPQGPQLPAITALVVNGMLMRPDIDHTDPHVARAIDFLLSHRTEEGGIYDRILANYNTAISVSALARVGTPEAAAAVNDAIAFLRTLQWHEGAAEHPETGTVTPDHPFYGGVGYGGSSRPDNSNLNLFLQAFHDAGVDCNDPAIQRALTFLQRTQMLDSANDMPYADGSTQGGFIYATSPDGDNLGIGESKAGTIEETLTTGETVSRLRAYGSMTYAGFKTMIYADLDRDDQRVRAAYDWLKNNYTLEENPGVGLDGYYYYLLMMARALDAWGLPTIETETIVEGTFDFGTHEFQNPAQPTIIHADALTLADGTTIELADPLGAAWFRFAIDEDTNARTLEAWGRDTGPEPGDTGLLRDARAYRLIAYLPEHLEPITNLPPATSKSPPAVDAGQFGARIAIITRRDWANDLIDQLATLQNEDGSFRSVDDRWMEGNTTLITAYALLALQHAMN
ncbi:MAG: hypothetical protein ACTS3F_09325 [Phycisphaerales bacterium]